MIASTPARLVVLAALLAVAAPAAAQEMSVPDYQGDYAGTLLHRRLSESMMDYQRRRMKGERPDRRRVPISARARATCANKGRAAARFGRAHPKVRQLYALCARAGD